MKEKYKLTQKGKEDVKRRRSKILAVFDDTRLSLHTMSTEPTKAWTAKDLHKEIGGGIPPADVPFFGRRLKELEKKGFVEKIQSPRLVGRSRAPRITPKTPRLRR